MFKPGGKCKNCFNIQLPKYKGADLHFHVQANQKVHSSANLGHAAQMS